MNEQTRLNAFLECLLENLNHELSSFLCFFLVLETCSWNTEAHSGNVKFNIHLEEQIAAKETIYLFQVLKRSDLGGVPLFWSIFWFSLEL